MTTKQRQPYTSSHQLQLKEGQLGQILPKRRKYLACHHSESSITPYTIWSTPYSYRDNLRSRDPTSAAMQQMNDEITRTNEAITFNDSQVSSPKQISNYFNRQFTTSKLGRHTSSRETRLVSREIKRKSLTSLTAEIFTTDQVTKGISNCSNTRAFEPDNLRIFHLKDHGPKAIEYLTVLFNDSVTSCRIPAIWKPFIVIPITKPGKDYSLCTSYRSISLSAQQRKLWRLSCLPVSISTCSQRLINTDSDPDYQQLLHFRTCISLDIARFYEEQCQPSMG